VRAPAAVWRNAPARRLILGYTWHNWELLGMWAWAPAFLAASLAIAGHAAVAAAEVGSYLIAVMHLVGALASPGMGHLSDRLGRRAVMVALAAIAAALSLGFGWMVAWPIGALIAITLLYGFAAIGDSPVLSTALTESVPPAYLGSALAVRSFPGFTTGAISPLVFGYVLDLTNPPGAQPTLWGPAFMALAVGGLFATWCAWRFRPGA
jgi:MFS family permease